MNVFTAAKAYVKKHPKTDWQDAIQKVSGKTKSVSGTKKKKAVSGAKKTVKAKKRVSGVSPILPKAGKRISGVTTVKKSMISGTERQTDAIVRNINRLENKRKGLKTKQEKDVYALMINKEHDKLDHLKKQLKKR